MGTDCGERVRYGAREHTFLTLVRLANVNELSSIILQLSTQAPPIGFFEFGLFEKLDYLPSERNRQSGHQTCIYTSRLIRHAQTIGPQHAGVVSASTCERGVVGLLVVSGGANNGRKLPSVPEEDSVGCGRPVAKL